MLHEFVISVSSDEIEHVIEKLTAAGIINLYYEAPIEVTKVRNGYDFIETNKEIIELKIYGDPEEVPDLPESYFNQLTQVLAIEKSAIHYQKIEVDYSTPAFTDVDLGNGWVIAYPGSDEDYTNKQVLKFDPQAAFGTGLHETTQDCLRMLLARDLNRCDVLDLGTGSGILSVACARRGAKAVTAVDIEPVEREVNHNASLNDISTIQIVQADLFATDFNIDQTYDLIIINIGADETIQLIHKHQLLAKGKSFLISGIVEWNCEQLRSLFTKAGFVIKDEQQSNEWITLYIE
ncbi:50S ribosomal protein L11 methyltransferase [Desertibacillus haloalkaliphilus]|uniref:50S ribosomal protein L11 methyltransferase n=1 Tax=Desertibacillus haloalkaliphilus TaxID=1328930 RepID=UPI001C272A7E|nr:50S ribosomal protein L11 methyltransferase [Desertibacillus haloalkaliphilus]MBU8908833.1 50S ribosomal protein L11 methyltransferase [Desertibacillus haloalkaliphilus]